MGFRISFPGSFSRPNVDLWVNLEEGKELKLGSDDESLRGSKDFIPETDLRIELVESVLSMLLAHLFGEDSAEYIVSWTDGRYLCRGIVRMLSLWTEVQAQGAWYELQGASKTQLKLWSHWLLVKRCEVSIVMYRHRQQQRKVKIAGMKMLCDGRCNERKDTAGRKRKPNRIPHTYNTCFPWQISIVN
jgi:hypothetical protein